jgi:hypothetical protein
MYQVRVRVRLEQCPSHLRFEPSGAAAAAAAWAAWLPATPTEDPDLVKRDDLFWAWLEVGRRVGLRFGVEFGRGLRVRARRLVLPGP